MPDRVTLKEDYVLAACCSPSLEDSIIGYYSHNNILKVHRDNCPNLRKADPSRLLSLDWKSILAEEEFHPDDDYESLDDIDFRILRHHRDYGIDYSLVVARVMQIDKKIAFDRHRKLREMGLIERVEAVIVRYRKGIVDNKWIKHRNHTYFDLTTKGRDYLNHFLSKRGSHR